MSATRNILPMAGDIKLAHKTIVSTEQQNETYEEASSTWNYILATLYQYKYWILLLAMLSAVGSGLYASLQTPLYRGSTTLLIETQKNNLTGIEGVYGLDTKRSTFLETQFALLNSRTIALHTMEQVDLDAYPEYSFATWEKTHSPGNGNILRKLLDKIKVLAGQETTPDPMSIISEDSGTDDASWRRWQLKQFRKHISINPVSNTQLVEIRFDSNSPQLAADAANTMARSYIDLQLMTAANATTEARGALSLQLDKLKQQLMKAESNLQSFREEKGLVGLSSGVTYLTENRIGQLAERKLKTQMKLAELEDSLAQIDLAENKTSRLLVIPIIRNDPVVQAKDELVTRARQTIRSLENRYHVGHPDLVTANDDLDSAQRARRAAITSVTRSLKNQLTSAKSSITKLEEELSDAKLQLEKIQSHQVELTGLERAVLENRSLFDAFFKRLRETDAIDGLEDAPRARIVDPAIAPENPIKPSIPLALVAGGLLGALFTILWIMLQGLRSKSLRDITQASSLPLQVLGSLPIIKNRRKPTALPDINTRSTDLFAERLQIIATDLRLHLNTAGKPAKRQTIFVTSAVEGQGKTTISTSLAISYAQMGTKVLLIDSDMRLQQLSRRLDINNDHPGFTDYITRRKTLGECAQQGPMHNLHVMGFGKIEPVILHRMSQNGQIEESLQSIKEHYEMIIIDSAPLSVTAETRELMLYCDALVFVSTPENDNMSMLKAELEKLQEWASAPKYLIVNKFDDKKTMQYGSYSKTSGYYA